MSNLLEKASILTTPTAYDDGRILSVKPAKTFGSELVTNGTFDTDTDWNKDDSWTISGGKANYNYISGRNLNSSTATLIVGRIYQIKYDILDYVSGSVENSSAETQISNNSNGTYTEVFTARYTFLRFRGSTNGEFSIDNVSVKEVIDGDFDFTRNSSATRVNSQGLVEDVQILSSNLVQNGDFSQEGAELVTNGNFATDSDWGTNDWNISDGSLNGSASTGIVFQNNLGVVVGKTYKVVLEISNYTSGLIRFKVGGASYQNIASEDGVQEFYFVAATTANNILFSVQSAYTGSIDNVSVKEVGQNWTITDSDANNYVEFGDGTARLKFLNTSPITSFTSDTALFQGGKKYKLTVDVKEVVSGGVKIDAAGVQQTYNSVGVQEAIIEPTGNSYISFYRATANVDITLNSVSLIEITDDTNLPRINYEGFSYQDSLGSELITNGDFATNSDWILGNGWSIGGGEAVALNSASGQRVTQDNILQVGKIYKLTYEVKSISSGGFKAFVGGVALQAISNIGVYTETITTPTINDDFFIRTLGTTSGSIDNVSVKEYLGQEVVPDSGVGSWLFEPQSTNLITQSQLLNSALNLKADATITDNYGVSPTGEANSSRIQFADTTAFCYAAVSVSTAHTASVFVKGVSGETVRFGIGGNVTTGELFTFNGLWQRINFTASSAAQIFFSSYLGATTSDFEAFGLQLEALSFATSYIPTNGSTVTRLQDAAFGAGSSDLINSTEGVLYAEIATLANFGTRAITLSSGLNNDAVLISFNSNGRLDVNSTSGGSYQAIFNYTGVANPNTFNKIAFKYKQDDFSLFVNGVKVATDTSGLTPIGLNVLNFAKANSAQDKFFGKTKCLAVFKEALTDKELTCLTTI